MVDASGIPLAWSLTGGNRNDVTQLIPLVERVPPVRGRVGRPRRRPGRLTADRAYDHRPQRRELRKRGIEPEIARRQSEHGSGLGRVRWVVERTFALAAPVQAAARPLRPPRRDPRSLPRAWLLPRLRPTTQKLIVIRVLRRQTSRRGRQHDRAEGPRRRRLPRCRADVSRLGGIGGNGLFPLAPASLPIVGSLQRHVGMPGLSAPDNPVYGGSAAHTPNEHIRVADFVPAIAFTIAVLEELGR